MKELIILNEGILHHIKSVSSKTSRFSAAVKLGMPIQLVESVCELDPLEVKAKAAEYADKDILITCSNLVVGKALDLRSTSVDSFYKSSMLNCLQG